MLLTEVGNFGYQLYTHDAGLGIGNRGAGVYGRKNANFVPNVSGFLSRNYFERFGQTIPREPRFEEYGTQPVQITTLPLELRVTETQYKQVLEKDKGLKGLLGKKHTQMEQAHKERVYTTSQLLEESNRDEPAYVVQWAVPWFHGFGSDRRPGTFFIFSTLMGESDVPTIRKIIQENPEIVRETGEFLFPDMFAALEKGVPYRQLPHYLLEESFLSERNLRQVR